MNPLKLKILVETRAEWCRKVRDLIQIMICINHTHHCYSTS